jgi:hypothetical protein
MSTRPVQSLESLPHNYNAERCILGAILVTNSYIETVAHDLTALDFYIPDHQTVFRAMAAMHEDQQPMDPLTLGEFLGAKRCTTLGGVSTVAYLASLQDGVPSVVNIAQYIAIVKEKAYRRSIIHLGNSMQKAAMEPETDVAHLEKLIREGQSPSTNGNGKGHVDFKDFSLVDFMAAKFPPKEHLIQAITPRNGRSMLIALPHRLKSWFTTGLALASTRPSVAFGHLNIEKPVRTYLAQLEDWPGELQARISSLLVKQQFSGCDPQNLRILPRCDLDLTKDTHFAFFTERLKEFKPDHVILDVLRKFFSGDVNSPKETAAFLRRLDQLQTITECALTLVHHENRKKEELMLAAAGSYNWAGWAEVMIHFSRKTEAKTENGPITAVEIEVDSKAGPPVEPMRLVLDTSLQYPLRMEALEDGTGFRDAMKQLAPEGWTVDNLANVLEVHRKSAWKRIESWEKSGKIEKIKSGKRGRGGGLAIWHSLDPLDSL